MLTLFLTKLFITFSAFILLSLCLFVILRLFDRALGIDFKQAFNKIEQDAGAMSHYFAMRFLSLSLLTSIVLVFAYVF